MANHLAGEVEVKALGKTLTFRLGVNEMLELQSDLGLADKDDSFLACFDEDKLRNLGVVRKIVRFGLKRDHPDLTLEEAGDIITELGLAKLQAVIKQALKWALPEPEPAKEGGAGGDARPSGGRHSSKTPPAQASRP